METNLNKIAQDLYGKIQTRFPNIKIGDENAVVLSKKQDIPQARFFEFDYTEGGERLGTIVITLDADDGLIVQVSGDLADTENFHSSNGPLAFIRSFRKFAKDRLMKFDVQNIGKSNLDKRDYAFNTKSEPSTVFESKMYGTNRLSYQDLGSAKLIVKHTSPINLESPLARTSNIAGIFIENEQGERFKYPYKHINGARALAEHVKSGGNPYDVIGKHIIGLSEELAHLRKFKNYVTRNKQLSETVSDITNYVIERIRQVKREITSLQRPKYYQEFAENFKEQTTQPIPETIMDAWVDRLTIRTFNEELKQVFPYIYNLIKETPAAVVKVNPEDLLSEDTDENLLFSLNPKVQQSAIEQLVSLFASPIENGPDATNSILSVKGLIDSPELTNALKHLEPEADARQTILDFIKSKDSSLVDKIEPNNPQETDTVSESDSALRAKFIKLAEQGAELSTRLDFGARVITIEQAIRESGFTLAECGYDDNASAIDDILKSIVGFWNPTDKNFTIGGTKVKIKVMKNFKDGAYPDASESDVSRALKIIEKMDPSQPVTESSSELNYLKALVDKLIK